MGVQDKRVRMLKMCIKIQGRGSNYCINYHHIQISSEKKKLSYLGIVLAPPTLRSSWKVFEKIFTTHFQDVLGYFMEMNLKSTGAREISVPPCNLR